MSNIADWLVYAGFRIALLPFQLSSIRVARKIGAALGLIAYRVAPVRKKLVARNIGYFFPDWDPARRERLVREAVSNGYHATSRFIAGRRRDSGGRTSRASRPRGSRACSSGRSGPGRTSTRP